MKNAFTIILSLFTISIFAQPITGYYNGTDGLDGDNLKTALHNIINEHKAFSYTDAWSILRDSDKDPNNAENVILVYTGRSQDKDFRDRGSDYDYEGNGYTLEDSYNREHVWAKSHGDFGTETGAGSDVHNLKPVDRTVNEARSYKDFDNGGAQHDEATECFSDSDSWEPRDAVKGDIARIIFYMDTRYEGTNGELDLTVVDAVNTFPNPQHGKLSTLLEWNSLDPPDDFERNRNNVIYTWQKNRNPFIDNPEFAELIWGAQNASDITIANVSIDPEKPGPNDAVTIYADISADTDILEATLNYGTTFGQVSSTDIMTNEGNSFYATIPAQEEGTKIYYSISARTATDTASSVIYMFQVETPFAGTIVSIKEIQGETATSPYLGEIVSTTGIVTGVFGTSFYMQDKAEPWSGIYVYNSGFSPSRGDSIIITGEIDEYFDLTEYKNISYFKVVSSSNPVPAAVLIETAELSASSTTTEQYEGVLVKVENAVHLRDTLYGMWFVDDGSGECLIHNPTTFSYQATPGNVYNIQGIATYTYGENKIDIRDADDVEEAPDTHAPTIESITVPTANTIEILFNEDVDYESAIDTNNYSLSDGISILSIIRHSIQYNKVYITTSGMTEGDHTITIVGVKDLSGNTMESQEFNFYSPYTNIHELAAQFFVFPNPAKDKIMIESSFNYNGVRIISVDGKMVLELSNMESHEFIDISKLDKGLYILQIKAGNEKINKKIIIN